MAKKVLKMVQKRFASHVKKSRKEDSKGKKKNLKNDDPVNENGRFLRAPGRKVDENRLQKDSKRQKSARVTIEERISAA